MMNSDKKFSLRETIPRTLSQSIYNYLKELIIKKELKANQRIMEKEYADIFNVSRTPVREAIVKLAAEGFVKIVSHREAVVKEVSYDELREIFQVIGILDSLAVALIVESITPEELMKIEKMTFKMEDLYKKNEVEKFINVNYTIHDSVWDYLNDKNKFLQRTLRFCLTQIKMCYFPLNMAFQNTELIAKSMSAHKEIFDSLKNRDVSRLRAATLEHWIPPLP